MKICNFLKAEHIFLDVTIPNKDDVLQFLADTGHKVGLVRNKKGLLEGLRRRERIMSTGVGDGIALPHAAASDVVDASVLLVRLAIPIDFDSLDTVPVDIILALILPEGQTHLHLRLLAGLSRLCKSPEFLALIRMSHDTESLVQALHSLEEQMAFH